MSAGGGTPADLTGLMQSLWEEEEGLMALSQLCVIAIAVLGSPAQSDFYY